jgi:hypothetical protein
MDIIEDASKHDKYRFIITLLLISMSMDCRKVYLKIN